MDQFMDQVKVFVRFCVTYRFWISIGFAALFAIIAYFVGAGAVQEQTKKKTDEITSAAKDVEQYKSPSVPTPKYKPIVEEKTAIANRDVTTAWKQLYDRQSPLLTWPETVQERFRKWGRTWPENVAESAVQLAIDDYIVAYKDYVDRVYATHKPFNYETGKGIVASPPKEQLLQPVTFDRTSPPGLGAIWSAQERLWIQRTALEVVAQVNRNANDWDSAIVKQINLLEVGNPTAQDQRSIAKGEQLAEADPILAPGEQAPEEAAAAAAPAAGMSARRQEAMSGGGGGTMGMGMSGGMGMATTSENVMFIKPEVDKGQYKILPIMMSVLVDQDHIQDLLVELENSPMSIQVKDFELQRPSSRVTKPEKGAMQSFAGFGDMMMGGMMRGMMGQRRGMEMMSGYGGQMAGYGNMMSRMMGGMGQMRGGMGGMGGYGMMGGMGAGATAKSGTDIRGQDRSKTREEEKKAAQSAKGPSLFDPYYDIVEVKVYGQARFYNAPPELPPAEPSPGEMTTGEAPPAAEPEAAKAEVPKAEPAPGEPAKAETPKAEGAPGEPAKAEPPKAETPKTEPGNAAPGKASPAPGEPAKPEAPKAEAPKSEPAPAPAPAPGTAAPKGAGG
jgi:hypothetical protein